MGKQEIGGRTTMVTDGEMVIDDETAQAAIQRARSMSERQLRTSWVEEELMVSDPGYADGDMRLKAAAGYWQYKVKYDPETARVAALIGTHGSAHRTPRTRELVGTVGVDSGQMCIAPVSMFGALSDQLYDDVCKLTCSPAGAGTINSSAVCEAGWGDGSYPVWVERSNKYDSIVSIEVVFIYLKIECVHCRNRYPEDEMRAGCCPDCVEEDDDAS